MSFQKRIVLLFFFFLFYSIQSAAALLVPKESLFSYHADDCRTTARTFTATALLDIEIESGNNTGTPFAGSDTLTRAADPFVPADDSLQGYRILAGKDSLPAEQQVPLLLEPSIPVLTSEMDVKLHLFDRYDGFSDATLYRLSDSLYVLEIRKIQNGLTSKTRLLLNEEELKKVRTMLHRTFARNDPYAGIDQSGRSLLLGNIYSLSTGLFGWGIPYMLNLKGSAAVGTYLIISSATILGANALTEHMEISKETANFTIFGTGMGVLHGILLASIAQEQQKDVKLFVGLSIVGSVVEGSAAYTLAQRKKYNNTQLEFISSATVVGMLYAYGFGTLVDQTTAQGTATMLLIGSTAGAAIGASTAHHPSLTSGNQSILRGGFLLGVYLPMTWLIAGNVDKTKAYVASEMAGGALGILVGASLIKGKNFSTEEGLLVISGILGGALLTGGIPVLLKANAEVSLVLSGFGAVTGFGILYSKYSETAVQRAKQSSQQSSALSRFDLSLSYIPVQKKETPVFVPAVKLSIGL